MLSLPPLTATAKSLTAKINYSKQATVKTSNSKNINEKVGTCSKSRCLSTLKEKSVKVQKRFYLQFFELLFLLLEPLSLLLAFDLLLDLLSSFVFLITSPFQRGYAVARRPDLCCTADTCPKPSLKYGHSRIPSKYTKSATRWKTMCRF